MPQLALTAKEVALIVKCQLIEPYSFVQIDFEIHDVEPVAKKGDREI